MKGSKRERPVRTIKLYEALTGLDPSLITAAAESNTQVENKSVESAGTFTIKQKRIKECTVIPLLGAEEQVDPFFVSTNYRGPKYLTIDISSFLAAVDAHAPDAYKQLSHSRKREELMYVQLSRRLLRTQRTLVLPAQTNLTLVTNSYDVVHSWFLPSLGLKMDCVPGRSTHHTFYVDSTGFFYGQCAEVCGRYHHHMPIRICMLPFDHFIV